MGKQFSCQKHPVLLKSFTEDKGGRAARSIEQSETQTEKRVGGQNRVEKKNNRQEREINMAHMFL